MDKQNDMNITIPTDIVESAVRDKITAAIARELGDPQMLVETMVKSVLEKKVDSNGKVPRYSSDEKYTLIELMARNTIVEAANEAMKEYFSENKNLVKEAVKKQIAKSPNKIAQAFVTGLADSLDCSYRNTVTINFNRDKNEY